MSTLAEQVNLQLEDRRQQRLLVEAYGDENQQERYTAGLLPENELLMLARTVLFAPFSCFHRWEKIDFTEVKHDKACNGGRVTFTTRTPDTLDAAEWTKFKSITALVSRANQGPLHERGVQATVELVEHVGSCSHCKAEVFGRAASIRIEWAGHRLSREYTLEA